MFIYFDKLWDSRSLRLSFFTYEAFLGMIER